MSRPKVIAFYLPQFHPTLDNNEWWGKGFTEWTNVGKATPLYPGHYQPKVPADLGYYDLRLSEVREQQAELARDAGISGFCYYHYWFGNGKRELELPFDEVLRSGKPDFPFMLCWANESWHAKFWDNDGKWSSKKLLVEQTYPGEDDIDRHFYEVLRAFKDKRYITIDGKPAFMIYKIEQLPYQKAFIERWRKLALDNGLDGITFLSYLPINITKENIELHQSYGVDYIVPNRLYENWWHDRTLREKIRNRIGLYLKYPQIREYEDFYHLLIGQECTEENICPSIMPNWDHTPRSGKNGMVLHNATPELFKKHVEETFRIIGAKKNKIVFLKSWNEWGEGNYMEPDLRYGHGYLDALKSAFEEMYSEDKE